MTPRRVEPDVVTRRLRLMEESLRDLRLLAAALARLDAARVPNNGLLGLLVAQHRQASHEAARLLGVIAEINRANSTFDDGAVDRHRRAARPRPDPRPGPGRARTDRCPSGGRADKR